MVIQFIGLCNVDGVYGLIEVHKKHYNTIVEIIADKMVARFLMKFL